MLITHISMLWITSQVVLGAMWRSFQTCEFWIGRTSQLEHTPFLNITVPRESLINTEIQAIVYTPFPFHIESQSSKPQSRPSLRHLILNRHSICHTSTIGNITSPFPGAICPACACWPERRHRRNRGYASCVGDKPQSRIICWIEAVHKVGIE